MKNLLLSLNGRIPRKTYWMFFLAIIVLNVVALTLDSLIAGDDIEAFPVFSIIISLALIWPSIAIAVKRWHDRDKSGWWVFIVLVPLVGPIWALVENGFLAGTEGDNRFGPACV